MARARGRVGARTPRPGSGHHQASGQDAIAVPPAPDHSPLHTVNDRQNTVVATALAALFLVTVFLCPWRVEPRVDLRWSPIYQSPLVSVQTFDPYSGAVDGSRIEAPAAQIASDVMALQVLALALSAGAVYWWVSDADAEGTVPPG